MAKEGGILGKVLERQEEMEKLVSGDTQQKKEKEQTSHPTRR